MKGKPVHDDEIFTRIWQALTVDQQDHLIELINALCPTQAGQDNLVERAGHRSIWAHPGLRSFALDLAAANEVGRLVSLGDQRALKTLWAEAEGALLETEASLGAYQRVASARAAIRRRGNLNGYHGQPIPTESSVILRTVDPASLG